MAKQYGLIVPGKDKPKVITRPSVFDEDSDDDAPAVKPTGITKKIKRQDKITQNKALEEDPTVFQYDEIYDEMDQKRKESKLSRKDLDKKPKYIGRLLAAADKRKKENERRIERQVQKEREAEGEEFKDKDSFVTSAYRKKLEEMKELEELEKREEYLEAIGDVTKQGNLDGFYRHLYDQKVNYNQADEPNKSSNDDSKPAGDKEIKKEADVNESEEKSEEILSNKSKSKRKYRKRDTSTSEHDDNMDDKAQEDVAIIKKEHLPSNLDADSDFSIDSSSDSEEESDPKVKKQQVGNSSLTDPVNNELNTTKETANEEKVNNKSQDEVNDKSVKDDNLDKEADKVLEPPVAKKPRIDIWKKRTVGDVFDEAVKRYFERKSSRDL